MLPVSSYYSNTSHIQIIPDSNHIVFKKYSNTSLSLSSTRFSGKKILTFIYVKYKEITFCEMGLYHTYAFMLTDYIYSNWVEVDTVRKCSAL